MWEKIKAELANLFGSQNTSIVEGVKTAIVGEINALKATNASLVTSLEAAQGELQVVQAEFNRLSAESSAVTTQLDAALSASKIETKADATSAEKIQALADGVASTLAKLAVDPAKLPATAPAAPTETKADFSNLSGLEKSIAANRVKHEKRTKK